MRAVLLSSILSLAAVTGLASVDVGSPQRVKGAQETDPSATAGSEPSAAGFATPEEAVREYLEGVAHADVEQILSASAVDQMQRGYRFDLMVERLNSFQPMVDGPVHAPFFADIQRADWQSDLLFQVRWLAYSLLTPEPLSEQLEDLVPLYEVDAAWAAGLMAELDPARLSSLVVVDIRLPEPDLFRSAGNLTGMARRASVYSADELTERVALITFEGDLYAVGFTLLRYRDSWFVSFQSSPLSGLPSHGVARRMTIDEFERLTSE
jgi:hypothetical protein